MVLFVSSKVKTKNEDFAIKFDNHCEEFGFLIKNLYFKL